MQISNFHRLLLLYQVLKKLLYIKFEQSTGFSPQHKTVHKCRPHIISHTHYHTHIASIVI